MKGDEEEGVAEEGAVEEVGRRCSPPLVLLVIFAIVIFALVIFALVTIAERPVVHGPIRENGFVVAVGGRDSSIRATIHLVPYLMAPGARGEFLCATLASRILDRRGADRLLVDAKLAGVVRPQLFQERLCSSIFLRTLRGSRSALLPDDQRWLLQVRLQEVELLQLMRPSQSITSSRGRPTRCALVPPRFSLLQWGGEVGRGVVGRGDGARCGGVGRWGRGGGAGRCVLTHVGRRSLKQPQV